jgi:hypothetical protein
MPPYYPFEPTRRDNVRYHGIAIVLLTGDRSTSLREAGPTIVFTLWNSCSRESFKMTYSLAGETIMQKILIAVATVASFWTFTASAQQAVRPQWNYQGSAVCPDGYDYRGGLCRARGGYGYGGRTEYGGAGYGGGGGGGGGIEPRWNRRGSAVCPEGYDYHANSGLCRPQHY